MKNLFQTMLSFLLLINLSSYAQTSTDKFKIGMLKGLEELQKANQPDEFLKTANYFERVAQAESKQWLPAYYAAYANLMTGLMGSDKKVQDQYFDKALQQIVQADALAANNSEILALKGYIQFMKMSIDPQARLSLMAESSASLGKAKALNPDNPRIYLINGQNTFYTPEAFGGGKAKAKPILENAVAKFAIFKAATDLDPIWGAERAKTLLAQCK
jgi:hypothetical protein